jgi:hypothetical protein
MAVAQLLRGKRLDLRFVLFESRPSAIPQRLFLPWLHQPIGRVPIGSGSAR